MVVRRPEDTTWGMSDQRDLWPLWERSRELISPGRWGIVMTIMVKLNTSHDWLSYNYITPGCSTDDNLEISHFWSRVDHRLYPCFQG